MFGVGTAKIEFLRLDDRNVVKKLRALHIVVDTEARNVNDERMFGFLSPKVIQSALSALVRHAEGIESASEL